MSEPALAFNNVSKCYLHYNTPAARLLGLLGLRLPRWRYEELWALREVTFSIKRGERVGLIGRNGAGKSTLLRLLTGQILPTSGKISVSGNIQALMEIGTGFHPDFTGLENIRSALAYQGVRPSQKAIDEIIDFAELEEFIGRPVREYSAGMYARLSFSVATSISPQILVVDEVLSAGDAYFSGKSIQRMKALTSSGATVLFVSHDISAVQMLCDRCIWIDKGRVILDDDALPAVKAYSTKVREDEELRLRARSMSLTRGEAAILNGQTEYQLFRLLGIDDSPPAKRQPFSVSTVRLGRDQDIIAALEPGCISDGTMRFLDEKGFTNWGRLSEIGGRMVLPFADFGGKFVHAPFSVAVPPESAGQPLWLEIEYTADPDVEVRLDRYDVKTQSYIEMATLRGEGKGNFVSRKLALLETGLLSDDVAVAPEAESDVPAIFGPERYGSHEMRIVGFSFVDASKRARHTLITGEAAKAIIEYSVTQAVEDPVAAVAIYRMDGVCALQVISSRDGFCAGTIERDGTLEVSFEPLLLGPGDYVVSVAMFKSLDIASSVEPESYDLHDRYYALKILAPVGVAVEFGIVNQPVTWRMNQKLESK